MASPHALGRAGCARIRSRATPPTAGREPAHAPRAEGADPRGNAARSAQRAAFAQFAARWLATRATWLWASRAAFDLGGGARVGRRARRHLGAVSGVLADTPHAAFGNLRRRAAPRRLALPRSWSRG